MNAEYLLQEMPFYYVDDIQLGLRRDLCCNSQHVRDEAYWNSNFSKLQKVIAAVSDLTTELKKAKDDIDTLKSENEQLKQGIREKDYEIQQNLTRIEQMDSYLRMDNLVMVCQKHTPMQLQLTVMIRQQHHLPTLARVETLL